VDAFLIIMNNYKKCHPQAKFSEEFQKFCYCVALPIYIYTQNLERIY
jgi:dihydrodipicolinate synthase/N-acetylneuraminate lyase